MQAVVVKKHSCYTEKLSLCNACQPALVMRLVGQVAEELSVDLAAEEHSLETAGEDITSSPYCSKIHVNLASPAQPSPPKQAAKRSRF